MTQLEAVVRLLQLAITTRNVNDGLDEAIQGESTLLDPIYDELFDLVMDFSGVAQKVKANRELLVTLGATCTGWSCLCAPTHAFQTAFEASEQEINEIAQYFLDFAAGKYDGEILPTQALVDEANAECPDAPLLTLDGDDEGGCEGEVII